MKHYSANFSSIPPSRHCSKNLLHKKPTEKPMIREKKVWENMVKSILKNVSSGYKRSQVMI